MNDLDFIRYSRQILLDEVGESGQASLLVRHVVVIGVGGLGSLVSQQLAAAGVGRLTLVDHDCVELSNLPRQLLFNESDIGKNKAITARDKLALAYSQCKIESVTDKFGPDNGASLVKMADMVIDCTDNFISRQQVNRYCVEALRPLVTASVAHFHGQIFTVDTNSAPESGCYHCLFPDDSQVSETCRNVGVLGPMVGVMASMQALMAINYLLGIVQCSGKLMRFDGLNLKWREASLSRDPLCHVCSLEDNGSSRHQPSHEHSCHDLSRNNQPFNDQSCSKQPFNEESCHEPD
ncbi:UBA/ThiF-type NAD/FAD binding protein [Shewanella sediminis HAW-EB3]|uniref:UBA/ThiF-type NAD/FAD binding protein n=1 Tax=Shewanella sediminis (strain HAW-EB3) TaxID=425104 RepID=A8FUV1_SHESH|nr:HesA/MoeB/ThiF family protein [Shewanella sediminis]ABV36624.1 UBA/ThiF-type NAD/FAD binding protein [Shewanella sediminis HAW-EB3]